MNLAEAIANIEDAEELFALLDVALDPALLSVHRIAILKRFGREIEAIERRQPSLCEDERRPLYAAALARTHRLYADGGSDVDPIIRVRPPDLVATDRLRRGNGRVAAT